MMNPTVDAIHRQFIKTVYLDAAGLLITQSPALEWGAFLVSLSDKISFQQNFTPRKKSSNAFQREFNTTTSASWNNSTTTIISIYFNHVFYKQDLENGFHFSNVHFRNYG
jgi:hypothetical protein